MYLLHEIGGTPSIGERDRFRQHHAGLLLADLPTVLALHLISIIAINPLYSIQNQRDRNYKGSTKEESGGDLEVIAVIGIATASLLLEVGKVLELRSEVEDVEHHRRGGAGNANLGFPSGYEWRGRGSRGREMQATE